MNGWKDLDPRRSKKIIVSGDRVWFCIQPRGSPVSDQSYMLAIEINARIPVRSVEKLPLVVVQARNIGPPPCVQETAGVDEHVAVVVDDRSILHVRNFDVPSTLLCVPGSLRHPVAELGILLEVVFLGEIFEILVDFSRPCVHGRPVLVGFEAPRVSVGSNIAGTSL